MGRASPRVRRARVRKRSWPRGRARARARAHPPLLPPSLISLPPPLSPRTGNMPALRPVLATLAAALLGQAGRAHADCAAEITAISHGACAGVRGPLFGAAGTVSAYAGGAVACPALQADAAALVPAAILTDECCTSLRSFVAGGCACDGDVLALLEGIQILPPGADAAAAISGVVALIQGSRCSGPALGGPLLDACTGGTGCPVITGSGGVVA